MNNKRRLVRLGFVALVASLALAPVAEAAGISVATAEHRIVGLPPLELRDGRAADR